MLVDRGFTNEQFSNLEEYKRFLVADAPLSFTNLRATISRYGTQRDDDCRHKTVCSQSDRTGIARPAYLPE